MLIDDGVNPIRKIDFDVKECNGQWLLTVTTTYAATQQIISLKHRLFPNSYLAHQAEIRCFNMFNSEPKIIKCVL
jgi:hypothetical protein